jgi:hypothetical protein
MKNIMQRFASFPKSFKLFLTLITLLSIFGGYQLSQLINGTNDKFQQRTHKLLVMERSLNEATIALGQQIQEWKDMLLRANDTELFNKHREAFQASSLRVQEALLRTKMAMTNDRMHTYLVEKLLNEHQSLLSDYLLANTRLNSQKKDSYLEVDKQAIGVDRNLQKHIADLRADIEYFSDYELNETVPSRMHLYLIGLLGALSLLIMSLGGVFFARHFYVNAAKTE